MRNVTLWAAAGGLSLLAASCAHADFAGFGNFSRFPINQGDNAAPPAVFPDTGTILLANGVDFERRSVFYDTPQPIGAFTAAFTYRAGGDPFNTSGGAFVLQNSAAGAHALGRNFSVTGFGYDGIAPSAAVTLESNRFGSFSGYYTGGVVGGGSANAGPVDLTGNPIRVTIAYDGFLLTETLRDLSTSASFTRSYITDLPSILGGPTAYVGITAATGASSPARQFISDFSFNTVPEPSSAVVLAAGCAAMGIRRRQSFTR